jgi:hypothetical protein
MFIVNVIESERGWGQKVDDVKEFDTIEEADEFVKTFNDNQFKEGPVPDIYWMAGEPRWVRD